MKHTIRKATSYITLFSIMLTGCSTGNSPSESTTINQTPTTTTTIATESTTEETEIVYDFIWNDTYDDIFNDYALEQYGDEDGWRGSIPSLVELYGLKDNPILQGLFTDWVNETFDHDYECVPFESVNYFSRLVNYNGAGIDHAAIDEEENFNNLWYYDEEYGFCCNMSSPFEKKYYFSYLVATGKPYGEMIGYSELNRINPGHVDPCDLYAIYDNFEWIFDADFDPDSPEHMILLLEQVNASIYLVCEHDYMIDMDIAAHEDRAEIINGYIEQHTPGVRIGQPVTREMYIELFGEEPYEFDYL